MAGKRNIGGHFRKAVDPVIIHMVQPISQIYSMLFFHLHGSFQNIILAIPYSFGPLLKWVEVLMGGGVGGEKHWWIERFTTCPSPGKESPCLPVLPVTLYLGRVEEGERQGGSSCGSRRAHQLWSFQASVSLSIKWSWCLHYMLDAEQKGVKGLI